MEMVRREQELGACRALLLEDSTRSVPSVLTWSSLPINVRHMIISTLAKEAPGLARYASVCREWQEIIEAITFSHLRVTPSCLSHLNKFARPRRKVLRCIELCILLQEYDCSQCDLSPDDHWRERDQYIIDHALRALMFALANWESCDSSLTIDISVLSPSDANHHFQNFIFGNQDDRCGMQNILIEDDERHGWRGNRQVSYPPIKSLGRVFSLIELTDDFWLDLPQVKTVTRIQLRRQTRRQWCQYSLQRLIPYFHGLQALHYEPCRDWFPGHINESAEYSRRLIESLPRNSLRHLVMFEDFDDYYIKNWPLLSSPIDPVVVRRATMAVSGALAEASLLFESLSASFNVDASHFFTACQSTWTWTRLISLALTSRDLKPDLAGHTQSNDLLHTAASIAMKMPKLHTMALWNYDRKYTCAFLYKKLAANRLSKVTWRATWDIDFTTPVIEMWETVALSHEMLGLLVVKELLNSELACISHGHAIKHLMLPCQVLHPGSLLEIQQEFVSCRASMDLHDSNRTP